MSDLNHDRYIQTCARCLKGFPTTVGEGAMWCQACAKASRSHANAIRQCDRPVLVGYMYKDEETLAVWCPFCRSYHFHGWTMDKVRAGCIEHRVAHCDMGSPLRETGYYITSRPPALRGDEWTEEE